MPRSVATRRILSGESMASGEIEPPANQLERLLQGNETELSAVSGGWRMILNGHLAPVVRRHAPSIPYMWAYQAVVASPNVRGVQSGYSTSSDWTVTSLR